MQYSTLLPTRGRGAVLPETSALPASARAMATIAVSIAECKPMTFMTGPPAPVSSIAWPQQAQHLIASPLPRPHVDVEPKPDRLYALLDIHGRRKAKVAVRHQHAIVPEAVVIVLDLDRPVLVERPLDAGTRRPADPQAKSLKIKRGRITERREYAEDLELVAR